MYPFSVKTDLQPGGAISRLYIADANRQDLGNYTCSLADIAQATVLVHVLNGSYTSTLHEHTALLSLYVCVPCTGDSKYIMKRPIVEFSYSSV